MDRGIPGSTAPRNKTGCAAIFILGQNTWGTHPETPSHSNKTPFPNPNETFEINLYLHWVERC